jgi:hypothetical protein
VPLIPIDGDPRMPEPRRDPLVPGVTFAIVRGEVVKQQTYAQGTPHRRAAAMRQVWIRTGAGEDPRFELDAATAPALEGHTLSFVTGTSADGTVHPLYVKNHDTGQAARLERGIRKVAGDDEGLGCTVPIALAVLWVPVAAVAWFLAGSDAGEQVMEAWLFLVLISRWGVLAITRPTRRRRINAVDEQVNALAARL